MSADILLYKADKVPVGTDQIPHLEFAREIVRSFNYRYQTDILVEPHPKVTQTPKVLGLDGERKMSKSLNNHIELAATPEETEKRVMGMVTDPQRVRLSFSPPEEISQINKDCRKAEIGCVDCKRKLAVNLNKHLEPFRARRADLEKNPDYVKDILLDGGQRARVIASETMEQVRDAIGFFGARD